MATDSPGRRLKISRAPRMPSTNEIMAPEKKEASSAGRKVADRSRSTIARKSRQGTAKFWV